MVTIQNHLNKVFLKSHRNIFIDTFGFQTQQSVPYIYKKNNGVIKYNYVRKLKEYLSFFISCFTSNEEIAFMRV